MKHLLQAILRWRTERVSLRVPTSTATCSAMDAALAMKLEMGPSQTKNDIVLRCISSITPVNTISDAPVSCDLRVCGDASNYDKEFSDVVSTCGSEPSTPSNISLSGLSMSSGSTDLQQELDRLRNENSQLHSEKRVRESHTQLERERLLMMENSDMENLFDDPSE